MKKSAKKPDDKIVVIQRPVIPEVFRHDKELTRAFLIGYLRGLTSENKL